MNAHVKNRQIRFAIELCLFLVVAVNLPANIQTREIPQGQVIERVICLNNANQSYALYLPINYSARRKWPILYAFDPGARGSRPVQLFKAGAEKYGYIVAGSNNSQNGPIAVSEEAMNAMIGDTQARFNVDDRRVYMTGFSGAARIAVAAAAATKGMTAGVIGCGAGFLSEIPPSAAKSFAYFALIGTEDFNYCELRSLDETLEKLGTAHRVEVFQGGHQWPSETLCTRAIEWLEIQAMKSGIRSLDAGWIDEMFTHAANEARACDDKQQFYSAYQRYAALVKDFAGLKDISPFQTRMMELQKSKEAIKATHQQNALCERQTRIETEILDLLNSALAGKGRPPMIYDLRQRFKNLRRQADQIVDEEARLISVRILSHFWMQLYQDSPVDIQNKNYRLAALRLEIMQQIEPENPWTLYQLSRAYALGGNKKGALKALKAAIEHGFKNTAGLDSNPDFDTIKDEPAFKSILSSLEK